MCCSSFCTVLSTDGFFSSGASSKSSLPSIRINDDAAPGRTAATPTVVSRKLAWCTRDYHNCHDADSTEAGYLTAAQTIALMTFPQDFRWCDDMKTETLQVNALGNAIPVRFAAAFFRAASPLE